MFQENFKIEKKVVTFNPIPEDKYTVELVDIELKDAVGQFAQPDEKVFAFTFALLDGVDTKGNPLRGRLLWSSFVPTFLSISPRSKKWPGKNELYRIVEAFTGQEMTDELAEKFEANDLKGLVGKQCVVFTRNTQSNNSDKIFSNIYNYIAVKTPATSLTTEEKLKYGKKETVEVNGIDIAGQEVTLAEAEKHLG